MTENAWFPSQKCLNHQFSLIFAWFQIKSPIFHVFFGHQNVQVCDSYNEVVWPKRKFKIIDEIKNRLKNVKGEIIDIDGIRIENDKGWFLIRASNTQNQLTCRAEALNKEDLYNLTNLIENQLKLSGVDFTFSHV